MSVRLSPRFRPVVREFRAALGPGEQRVFDLVCAAGELASRWPDDNVRLAMLGGSRDPRRRLAAEGFVGGRDPIDGAAAARLARKLVAALSLVPLDETRHSLLVLLSHATGGLAPDCRVPRDRATLVAWTLVLRVFARLFPSSVTFLRAPSFLGPRTLAALRREAAAGVARGRRATGQRPGPTGVTLAVDPRLARVVSRAVGRRLAPGYVAKFLFYTRAGDYVWPHPDDPAYAVNLLICVDRSPAPGRRRGSAFLGYRPNGSVERYELEPGQAIAVESAGLVHAREPLAHGERVVLLSILLRDAPCP